MTEREIVRYRAAAETCNACPLKAACTPGESGRTISRPWHEDIMEGVRAYHDTPGYAKAMRNRHVWPEPLFAEAKQWHGLRQFRLRDLEKVTMEGLFIAAGQNLKRWLAATGWGHRDAPCGSLAALARLSAAPFPMLCVRAAAGSPRMTKTCPSEAAASPSDHSLIRKPFSTGWVLMFRSLWRSLSGTRVAAYMAIKPIEHPAVVFRHRSLLSSPVLWC